MANRSDFASATLPRHLKKMLALQPFANAHEYGETKRLWIAAHATAKRVKHRMNSSPAGRFPMEGDSAEATTT